MLRTKPEEITDLLRAATAAKSGKVLYPMRTLKPGLMESMARDLRDYETLDANLERAIKRAEECAEDGLLFVLQGLRK